MTSLFSNFLDISQIGYMEQIYAFSKGDGSKMTKIPSFRYFNFHPVFLKDYNNAGTIS